MPNRNVYLFATFDGWLVRQVPEGSPAIKYRSRGEAFSVATRLALASGGQLVEVGPYGDLRLKARQNRKPKDKGKGKGNSVTDL
jgi:hypothetical protein